MKKFFNPVLTDKILFWGFSLSIFFLCFASLFVAIFFSQLPPFLPLYNELPWGYDRLGGKLEIFFPIGIALLFTISNVFFSTLLYKRNPLIARLLGGTTILICLTLCIYILQIIFHIK